MSKLNRPCKFESIKVYFGKPLEGLQHSTFIGVFNAYPTTVFSGSFCLPCLSLLNPIVKCREEGTTKHSWSWVFITPRSVKTLTEAVALEDKGTRTSNP